MRMAINGSRLSRRWLMTRIRKTSMKTYRNGRISGSSNETMRILTKEEIMKTPPAIAGAEQQMCNFVEKKDWISDHLLDNSCND
jgi:hypothetical protein